MNIQTFTIDGKWWPAWWLFVLLALLICTSHVMCLQQITLRRYFDPSNSTVKLQPLAVSKVTQLSYRISSNRSPRLLLEQ